MSDNGSKNPVDAVNSVLAELYKARDDLKKAKKMTTLTKVQSANDQIRVAKKAFKDNGKEFTDKAHLISVKGEDLILIDLKEWREVDLFKKGAEWRYLEVRVKLHGFVKEALEKCEDCVCKMEMIRDELSIKNR